MLFNGKNKTYVKTDLKGQYTYNFKPFVGDNNITAYYPGYHYYRYNKTETTFHISGVPTKLHFSEKIGQIENRIFVSGALFDENYKRIPHMPIDITFVDTSTNKTLDISFCDDRMGNPDPENNCLTDNLGIFQISSILMKMNWNYPVMGNY